MRRRFLFLATAVIMAATLLMGCGADSGSNSTSDSNTASEETESDDGYQYVTAAETVDIAKSGEGHVLDVREWSNYVAGRVTGSEWCSIFPLEEEELEEEMAAYAEKNLSDGESIYIICNSGQKGAQKTTEVLTEAGIDASLIYTVEGGAEALDKENNALTTDRSEESIDWQYINGEEALESSNAQIIDVRDDENYEAGHLKDSIHQDLTEYDDAEAQTAMYDMAVSDLDQSKPVYFLCYSGNKCAKAAISVLKDAGFELNNLYIIEDGAKGSAISEAFVTE